MAKSSTKVGIKSLVSQMKRISSSVTGTVLSKTRLSMSSTAHAISPVLKAPTMRPEPFRVWKPRRISASGVKSWGACCHTGRYWSSCSKTSSASSTKMSRISSSMSKLSSFSVALAAFSASVSRGAEVAFVPTPSSGSFLISGCDAATMSIALACSAALALISPLSSYRMTLFAAVRSLETTDIVLRSAASGSAITAFSNSLATCRCCCSWSNRSWSNTC